MQHDHAPFIRSRAALKPSGTVPFDTHDGSCTSGSVGARGPGPACCDYVVGARCQVLSGLLLASVKPLAP